ncbi:MAG: hypothetical protein R2746_06770 [Acidimicrobiales bacterium]
MNRTHRRRGLLVAVALIAGAGLVGCSSDDGDATSASTTSTSAPATTETEPASEPGDTTSTTVGSDGSGTDVETVDLLEFLQDEDAAIGDLFDWNTGAGVIAITYVGVQTVQLYNGGDLDAETAVAACELASDYVFPIDDGAAIEVLAGEYPDGTVLASVQGIDGTCAAA